MRRNSIISLMVGLAVGGLVATGVFLGRHEFTPNTKRGEGLDKAPNNSNQPGIQRISNFSSWDRIDLSNEKEDKYTGNIILSSVVAYSDYFSRAYGYPAELINNGLPEYIDFLAYEIKYAGSFQHCMLKALIDKDSIVELKPRPFFNIVNGKNLEKFNAALPKKLESHSERPYQREFRLNSSGYARFADYALSNFFLFGRGKNGDLKSFSSVSLSVMESNPDVFSEWVYVSLGVGCTKLGTNILGHDAVFLALPPNEAGLGLSEKIRSVGSKIAVRLPKDFQQDVLAVLNKINFEIR